MYPGHFYFLKIVTKALAHLRYRLVKLCRFATMDHPEIPRAIEVGLLGWITRGVVLATAQLSCPRTKRRYETPTE